MIALRFQKKIMIIIIIMIKIIIIIIMITMIIIMIIMIIMIIIMIIMIALRFQKKMGRAFSANHTESGCLPDCHSMKSPTTNHRHRY